MQYLVKVITHRLSQRNGFFCGHDRKSNKPTPLLFSSPELAELFRDEHCARFSLPTHAKSIVACSLEEACGDVQSPNLPHYILCAIEDNVFFAVLPTSGFSLIIDSEAQEYRWR